MYVEDKDLGKVKLVPNAKARRVIARFREQQFQLTHPVGIAESDLIRMLETMKPSLLKLREKAQPEFIFTEETRFSTFTFDVFIKSSALDNIYINLKDSVLHIIYPDRKEIRGPQMQSFVKKAIEEACRLEAKRILPSMVREMASKYGFRVRNVKINNSRGRWGSCSINKDINLSYFCMMLPEHLINYVILHELCHTKEMNHSKNFWALLDKVSDRRATELTKELKTIRLKW